MILVGGVVLAFWLISRDPDAAQARRDARNAPPPTPDDLARKGRTRLLVDSGLLVARGNLGSEVAFLLDSPAAFDQPDDEMKRGHGPALDGLTD